MQLFPKVFKLKKWIMEMVFCHLFSDKKKLGLDF